jgi:hypothetical protein
VLGNVRMTYYNTIYTLRFEPPPHLPCFLAMALPLQMFSLSPTQ